MHQHLAGWKPSHARILSGPPTACVRDLLRTYVNSEDVQQGNTLEWLFPFAFMLADLSRLMTLEPADIPLPGTPAHSRPGETGDLVGVEIDGIGRLASTMVETEDELDDVGVMPADTRNARHVALVQPEEVT